LRLPRCCGDRDDLPAVTPLSRRSGMSRLVMLSDATGVRAYAGVMPTRMLAQKHQSGYGACKDAAERANTAQTRHLTALWRITTASRLVAKDCGQRRLRLSWTTSVRSSRPGVLGVATGRGSGARCVTNGTGRGLAGSAPTSPGWRPGGAEGGGSRGVSRICAPMLSMVGQRRIPWAGLPGAG
jgi:hypothetical protein